MRVEVHNQVPEQPPPQNPGTQYSEMADDDSVPELSGLEELRPEGQLERHTAVGFELVLNPVVLGRELVDVYRLRQSWSTSLPRGQCPNRQRQLWSTSHLRQQCFKRQQLVFELIFVVEGELPPDSRTPRVAARITELDGPGGGGGQGGRGADC